MEYCTYGSDTAVRDRTCASWRGCSTSNPGSISIRQIKTALISARGRFTPFLTKLSTGTCELVHYHLRFFGSEYSRGGLKHEQTSCEAHTAVAHDRRGVDRRIASHNRGWMWIAPWP